jgi:hypothetical protein
MLIQGSGTQASRTGVVGAIRDAANATGTNFQYLLATAQVESGLNPQASAAGSSARGLFQFIDQTWLTTLKESGASLGYGGYADAITKAPSGRYEVSDPTQRAQIMALRNDPAANAAMAGAFTSKNADQLSEALGRAPTNGELYIAHFLGPSGAGRLITMAANNPGTAAASAFPGAAGANRSIFYDRQGNARTAAQVYGVLVGRYQTAVAQSTTATAAADHPVPPASIPNVGPVIATPPADFVAAALASSAAAPTPVSGQSVSPAAPAPVARFTSLYSDPGNSVDSGNREPVSQIVRELWSTRPTVAAALTGQSAPPGQPQGAPSGAPMGLFVDRPADVRGLFGS